MKINWKLRLKNKATLISLIGLAVSFVYKILDLIGVVPPFQADQIVTIASILVDILCLLGIVVDSTTAGIGDSQRALGYEEPYKDKEA